MANNGHGYIQWREAGPRVLAWLRAEAPRRSTVNGLAADCAAALGPPLRGDRLQDWLLESAGADWRAIKALIGTGNGNGSHGATVPSGSTSSPGRSLADYLKAKKCAACPVCQLPDDVKGQLAAASERGIKVADRLEWLTAEYGARITRADLEAHGRHLT